MEKTTGLMIFLFLFFILFSESFLTLFLITKFNMAKYEKKILVECINIKSEVDKKLKDLKDASVLIQPYDNTIYNEYQKLSNFNKSKIKIYETSDIKDYAKLNNSMNNIIKTINLTSEKYPELTKVFNAKEFTKKMNKYDTDINNYKESYNEEVKKFNGTAGKIPGKFIKSETNKYSYYD